MKTYMRLIASSRLGKESPPLGIPQQFITSKGQIVANAP
jgi:hypothetical protein